ncbi:MAG: cytochrome c family protein [Rickettsiales bacterium]|nr:cytochrome c family protein [Rickettsiales bacterium]|tara:strand:- start:780 stop:1286 length:507 start_codon:yes stop_codon:yes gene_type:complete
MNKYFLSLMSILILFQSFKVSDEIFADKDDSSNSYIIIKEMNDIEKKEEIETTQINEDLNFEILFSEANLEKGKKISKQCVACHDFSNNLKVKIGPPLWEIIGRKSASIKDFKYSEALNNFKKNWSREELFFFLEKPKDYIKGTKMVYKGLVKQSDRVDLISYLESLK